MRLDFVRESISSLDPTLSFLRIFRCVSSWGHLLHIKIKVTNDCRCTIRHIHERFAGAGFRREHRPNGGEGHGRLAGCGDSDVSPGHIAFGRLGEEVNAGA